MPSRESISRNRFIKPVAHRVLAPSLWRFTRRSVPRGVALGMITGILIPLGQIPASALLALPLRANVPAAVATTFVTNPFTTPPLWIAAYWVGSLFLAPQSSAAIAAAAQQSWGHWLTHQVGPATLFGLVAISLVCTVLGYFGSALGWRWWVGRKWRQRALLRSRRSSDSVLPLDR